MQGMIRTTAIAIAAATPLILSGELHAQQSPPQFPNMTFFITSSNPGNGADLGGLEGADKHCQTLAARHGAGGKTWRAYLSTQAEGDKPATNARDRIGKGPWQNAAGVQIAGSIEDLHSENNKIDTEAGLAEDGRRIPSRLFTPNRHDILTGSTADGRALPPGKDMTCGNWTKSGEGSAMVGHHDRMGLRDDAPSKSWNSSHPSRGCSLEALRSSGGEGLIYCFAAN
jgi:hypothetical protein